MNAVSSHQNLTERVNTALNRQTDISSTYRNQSHVDRRFYRTHEKLETNRRKHNI